ncbi:MAG TPA: nucleotidyltransferase domain-containing protein [Thermoanaerobaculia bacterium]|nr:nucleotidyltransferase domain-containing protein [Thermoanaerobaculia bacterium]
MALLDQMRDVLASVPAVRFATVFGSQARGQERAGSDIDIGLLLDPDTPELRVKIEAELGRAAKRQVDLVFLDSAPPLLRFEIARDGVLLVARDRNDWVDFRTRAMLDWWDWAPTARLIDEAAIRRLREKAGPRDGPS